ncbi:MAG: hypothetical protein ACFE9S_07670 [Candidatus Hermodarchaeota archaeon]
MDLKIGQEVDYSGHKAKVIGIIPAFFKVGCFPGGIDDIDSKYLELDFDKTCMNFDSVLIEANKRLIRTHPSALKELKVKKSTKKGK